MNTTEELHTVAELAEKLKRSESFIKNMKRRGFEMPGARATVSQAIEWLRENPLPCRKFEK